ncbi:hypothetical protein S7711_10460 [Stachybotrys chartarum IBT 7711]|uniref:Uncharacterized protein n=1 Tax=Stachybotrys chartarum (strain CBS 109288 / IBT 7711) TaxID=1280523 RepID=A0A084B6V3_STACB|nr:hypothetical protein S7711_10460 [Stachybotrys chartarum IBT 7711]
MARNRATAGAKRIFIKAVRVVVYPFQRLRPGIVRSCRTRMRLDDSPEGRSPDNRRTLEAASKDPSTETHTVLESRAEARNDSTALTLVNNDDQIPSNPAAVSRQPSPGPFPLLDIEDDQQNMFPADRAVPAGAFLENPFDNGWRQDLSFNVASPKPRVHLPGAGNTRTIPTSLSGEASENQKDGTPAKDQQNITKAQVTFGIVVTKSDCLPSSKPGSVYSHSNLSAPSIGENVEATPATVL